MKTIRNNLWFILTILFIALYAIAAILVSVHRFWQYDVFYYDFGIFDRALFLASRFQPPVIDHLVVGGKLIFADHFSPSLFLLVPLFWIFPFPETLLVAQALIVSLSGLVLYFIAKKLLNRQFLSLAVTVSYLMFVGLQNAIITDFHEVTVMTLPLMLTFWALIHGRSKLYYLFLLITLGCKESNFTIGLGLALFMIFYDRKRWRTAVSTLLISIIYSYLAISFIIPYFAGDRYAYSPSLPTSFIGIITAFFDNQLKIRTIIYSLGSFSFLPLFAPALWPLILQDFFVRFVPQNQFLRWDLGLHYSASLAPILAFSTVMALSNYQRKFKIQILFPIIGIIMIAVSSYLHIFKLHGPLGLAYNPVFYRHTQDFAFMNSCVKLVPKNSSIMAMNNILPHFTHQASYLMREDYEHFRPDYILFDNRPGQNPNNFFGVGDLTKPIIILATDPKYERIICSGNDQYLYRRKI